jgi:cytochrome b subunit of formate dehydrogenase
LIWVSAIGGLGFLIVHAIWVRFFAPKPVDAEGVAPQVAAGIPENVPRHSLAARLFHWIMAAAMLTLLVTAFLPKVGVPFAWVTYHWIAGVVLTASILYHIIHASFWLDFWSIWPDSVDMEDAKRRWLRATGKSAPAPRKFAKYPLENKVYHLIIVLTGLGVIITGLFMMKRVRTPFFTRNPYVFGDMTWGLMYVLHGLAGVGLIALIMAHIYFALRPEKLVITKSMIYGTLDRDHYLEHHDPQRWVPDSPSPKYAHAQRSGGAL